MKRITILTLVCLFAFAGGVMAQDTLFAKKQDEMKTVFGGRDGKIDHGGYGALTFGYTRIDDESALLIGGRGGWLINHHFTLGLAGYGFFNNLEQKSNVPDFKNYMIAGGYGGLFLEAIIAPNYPVHVAIPLTIGAGGVSAYDPSYWDYNSDPNYYYYDYNTSAFFVIEPGLEVEMNIVKFFRLSLGANYRWTSNINLEYSYDVTEEPYKLPTDILDGFTYHMTLKFGWF
jgi:hypothetical protein